MPKPYSQDLRDRVIDAVERGGMSCRAAARRYEISESVAIKWLERYRREGSPDGTLQDLCNRLWSERGVKADTSMMSRFLRRIGVTLKKRRSSRANRTVRT